MKIITVKKTYEGYKDEHFTYPAHTAEWKKFEKPIIARFEGFNRIEPFLEKGYSHKEGFLRGNGTLPSLSQTKEGNATYILMEKFDNHYKNGGVVGAFKLLGDLLESIVSDGIHNPDISEIPQEYKKIAKELFNVDFSKVEKLTNRRELNAYFPSYIESAIRGKNFLDEITKFTQKTVETLESELKENPGFLLYLPRSTMSIYYAYYDVCIILDAAKCNREYGITVSNATWFSCRPEALVGISIIHNEGFRRELTKDFLRKLLAEKNLRVQILDSSLNIL